MPVSCVKREVALFSLLLCAFASILAGCESGKGALGTTNPNQSQEPSSNTGIRDRKPSESSESSEKHHRPATWQDTRGFTPYQDYLPNEILVLFNDELELPADFRDNLSFSSEPSENEHSILYQNKAHADFARYLAKSYGLEILPSQEAYVPGFNFCGYKISSSSDTEELMQRLLDDNPVNIRLVEYNGIRKPLYAPNDPKVADGTQWHHASVNSFSAWDFGSGSEDTWIAVIDTGVDLDHPDLADNILPVNEMWPEEDFDLGGPGTSPEPSPGSNHGTHVAGISAGVGDNGIGIAGIAYSAKIMPIKISIPDLWWYSEVIGASATAMVLATELGADVINMSYGWYFPSAVEWEAAKYAYENGVLLTAAAGNENTWAQVIYPAGIPYVMAVGSLDRDNHRASYSNYGLWVDICAPGGSNSNPIYSTITNGYASYYGTSMASPMVAGALALLKSVKPSLTKEQYRALVESSGENASAGEWGGNFLMRMLDLANAVTKSPQDGAPTVEILTPADGSVVSGPALISFSAASPSGISASYIYIDGKLVSKDTPEFSYDFTDRYPGLARITVEVVDGSYQHAFDEIMVNVSEPRIFSAPYYSSFNSATEQEGWDVYNFGGSASWHLASDGRGGSLFRLDYTNRDVDWLVSPNIYLGNNTEAKIVFRGGWDHTNDRILFWVYPEDPALGINTFPLLQVFEPVSGFPGFYYIPISFDPGAILKVGFLTDLMAFPNGTFITVDDFYVAMPTSLPEPILISPAEDAVVSGMVEVSAQVTDDWGLARVDFLLNGQIFAQRISAPFTASFDSDAYPNGSAIVSVLARDLDFYDQDGKDGFYDSGSDSHRILIANHQIFGSSPSQGFYGDEVTILGRDFTDAAPEASKFVEFSGSAVWIPASTLSWTDHEIIVSVPEGAISGPIRVVIDQAYVQSPMSFIVINPFDDLSLTIRDAPADMMFTENFTAVASAQPDLDSISLRIEPNTGREWFRETSGDSSEQIFEVDISGLTTGKYFLILSGHYRGYSSEISLTFYLNTLPGDFNSDARVDDGDAKFLMDFIQNHGIVGRSDGEFLPYLDANYDGLIDERDASIVGYDFGNILS